MSFYVFSDLSKKIDTVTAAFVANTVSKLIVHIMPVVTVGLTLSFILYGWLVIRGMVETPMTEFMEKIIKISIVTSLALSAGLYQSRIAEVICKTPDELINVLIDNPTSVKGNEAASAIDRAADKGFSIASKAFDCAGFFSKEGIVYCVIGTITLITTGVFVALGGAILILSKLILSILAGVGPLFILALLWKPTLRFFEMWLAQIVNYILLGALTTIIFGLLLEIYNIYMSDIKFDGTQNVAATLGGAIILSVAMIIILQQVPALASALSGGVSLSYLNELRMMKGLGGSSSASRGSTKQTSVDHAPNPNRPPAQQQRVSKGYYLGSMREQYQSQQQQRQLTHQSNRLLTSNSEKKTT